MKNKDIISKNYKGQWHGYQEWYTIVNEHLSIRTIYKKGLAVEYFEWHNRKQTRFFIR
jgi:hypothetical protein